MTEISRSNPFAADTNKFFYRLGISSLFAVFFMANTVVSASEYVRDAEQYLQKGEFKAAIIQLKNQLKNKPDDAKARYLLGITYFNTGNTKQADKELTKAYKLNPDSVEVILAYARLLLHKREYDQVNKILDSVFNDKKEELQRQLLRGYAYLGLGQLAEAKQIFILIAEKNKNIQAYNGLAKIALQEKDSNAATQWVEKVLTLESDNKEALHTRAKVAMLLKQHDQALESYNTLITQYPEDQVFYLQRAAAFLALNKLSEAEKDTRHVLGLTKNQPLANFMLAQIKLQEHDYQAAQTAAENVLNRVPHHYPSMLILGIANFGQKNYNQADKYFTQYLSAHPENITAQILLANLYLAQGKAEEVILILEALDEDVKKSNVNILASLGSAYLLVGEYDKGIEALNAARSLEPESHAIRKRLIAGQFMTGNTDSALVDLEKLVESDAGNDKLNHYLIITYIQQKKLKKAEEKIKQFLLKKPDDPVLYHLKAVIAQSNGDLAEAKQAYTKALELDKNYIPALTGMAKVAIANKNYAQARNYFRRVIAINSHYIRAYIALATIADAEGNDGEAEKQLLSAFEQADNLQDQLTVATLLGKWYTSKKQPEKALLTAKKLLRDHPNDKAVLSLLVGAQLINKKQVLAEQTLYKIISQYKNDTKHRLLLANILNKESGREQDVLKLLDEVIQIKPDDPNPLILKAAFLIQQQQYQQALDVSKTVTEQFPDRVLGYHLEGDVYRAQKQFNKAINAYQKAYAKKPANLSLFVIADLLIQQGKQADAMDLLHIELGKNEKNIGIHFKLGSLYQKDNDYDRAAFHYLKMLELDNENVFALNNLALIYWQQNNPRAIELAEKAYNKSPDIASVADTYAYMLLKQGKVIDGLAILQKAALAEPQIQAIQFHLAEAYYLNNRNTQARSTLEKLLNEKKPFADRLKAEVLLEKLQEIN